MKKLLFALSILALAIAPSVVRAQASHEYSPLTESTVRAIMQTPHVYS